jgi:large subunit ribosomal protein L31
MKTAIHPTYFPEAKIVCACGNVMTIGSTVAEIHVELCSKCHPFYTGKQKLIDTSRRIEKFEEKTKAKTAKGAVAGGKKVKAVKRAAQKAAKKAAKKPTRLDETEA